MDRKEIVQKLGEHFGVKPKYLSVPSFAYEVRTEKEVYIVDRHGGITRGDGETTTLEEILEKQDEPAPQVHLDQRNSVTRGRNEIEASPQGSTKNLLSDLDGVEVKLMMNGHTAESLKNIINMLYSKQRLIMMAFETDEAFMEEGFAEDLNRNEIKEIEVFKKVLEELGPEKCPGYEINFEEQTFTFKLFCSNLNPERIKAFQDLCILIASYSKTLKRASFKQAQDDNPKYALRTWLIRIGMIGPEYKETRKTLLKYLEGSGAFRKAGETDET